MCFNDTGKELILSKKKEATKHLHDLNSSWYKGFWWHYSCMFLSLRGPNTAYTLVSLMKQLKIGRTANEQPPIDPKHRAPLSRCTIREIHGHQILLNLWEVYTGLAPDRLCDNIELYFDRHGFSSRNAHSLNVVIRITPNVDALKQSLCYADAIVWNEIPFLLQYSSSILTVFKMCTRRCYVWL